MACQSNLAFLLKGMNVRDAGPFYALRGRIFLSNHLMWRCLWRHLDQVEMIEVLIVSALDSPGLFEGPFEAFFEKFLVPSTERLP